MAHCHCAHTETRDLSEGPFVGPVVLDDTRAAHGCVTVVVECCACGARSRQNRNGCHLEQGPWGQTRAERRAHAEELREAMLRARVPEPVTLTRGDGAVAVLDCDPEGLVGVDVRGGPCRDGEREYILAQSPRFAAAALARREAFVAWQSALMEV